VIKKLFNKSKNQEKQHALEFPFVADSVAIEKKDILNYIRGKSHALLGNDFYYSYVYKNGILSFLAFASKKYISGALPVIAPALLRNGKYFYSPGGNIYYFIENNNGIIKTDVGYEEKKDYTDITSVGELTGDIPDTLSLRWSLQPENNKLLSIGITVFALSVIFFFVSDIKRGGTKQVITNADPVIEIKKQELPDVISKITDIGREVVGKGYIEKMQMNPEGLLFVIKFRDEKYVQSFISRRGGKYENDAVLYTSSFDNK
jgi:hypothetical protein